MYKIILLHGEEGEDIEFQSDIIFDNGAMVYIKGVGALNIEGRCFHIKDDLTGVERITYWYTFN